MEDWGNRKFEDSWKSAFDDAEVTPSPEVWRSVEMSMAEEEHVRMVGRVVFYQRLAAAMVILAMLTGTYAYFKPSSEKEQSALQAEVQTPVKDQTPVKSETSVSPPASANITNESLSSTRSLVSQGQKSSIKSKGKSYNESNQDLLAVASEDNREGKDENIVLIEDSTLPLAAEKSDAAKSKEVAIANATNEVKKTEPIVLAETSVLVEEPLEEKRAKEKKIRPGEGMWLAMGASAGNYNPGELAPSQPTALQTSQLAAGGQSFNLISANPPQSYKRSVGASYSVGVLFGKKIGQRWVLQGGITYLTQQIDYSSNFTSISPDNRSKAATADYFNSDNVDNLVVITTPYTVHSNNELISVPLQVGYLIIDRKIGLQINAGVSPDFFVKNTLYDKSGITESYSKGAGTGSPYRSVNVSTLLNTELSYKIAKNYRLSLVPGFRYSVKSAFKDTSINASPLVFDIGFRFKYFFD